MLYYVTQRMYGLSAVTADRRFGLLASRARLCFTGSPSLTRTPSPEAKGTFLLCRDGDISTLP